ncbi:MAG: dihydroorotase [Methanobacterium sp.]|jgi:dihydroorotase|uniref:dihydroorotase n=1 Tax=Methanobacterium sp. TaxID=2164 RepID=UPI0003C9DA9C|nr:dihydroorotase family protein [Methanobacterium sp.]MDI3549674.1 dihydroorotase [Methanobacterium sp.]CDG65746.1 Dihydroorotase [Methanobacterium sp. MB1]
MELCVSNCRLDMNDEKFSVGIQDGKIVSIKKSTAKLPSQPDEIIDVKGKLVLPGLIDAHVHFRDPGLTVKENFHTGSAAAAAGGFTTVLDMPNTSPPTNTPRAFREKMKIGCKRSLVDFGLHASVADLSDIPALVQLQPASFKIFMDLVDDDFLLKAFRKINGVGSSLLNGTSDQAHPSQFQSGDNPPLISLHAEDPEVVQQCTTKMKMKGLKPELYALARPPQAEIESIQKALSMASKVQQKIHFCHVSTKKSLELITEAKKSGLNVTSEITPHHLFLNSDYLKKYGNLAKTNPPLRDDQNRLSMNYLSQIDIIGTDHAPHTLDEKEKDVWDAPPGIPGLETILPLLLTHLNQGGLTVEEIKRLLCETPAKIFNIPNKGFIKEGMDADLVVVDLKKENIIDPTAFQSKAKYSPFKGFHTQGAPVITLVRGQKVMEESCVLKNKGKFIYS